VLSRDSTPCGCLSCGCQLYHNLKTERANLREELDLVSEQRDMLAVWLEDAEKRERLIVAWAKAHERGREFAGMIANLARPAQDHA
jgi:hypothetical protein